MTRTNYRVLAYYEDDCYSNEVYMSIINARSEEEINTYILRMETFTGRYSTRTSVVRYRI